MVERLVEDEELRRLRAMAEGRLQFRSSRLWERLAVEDMEKPYTLPAYQRLGVGYYTTARRRVESLKEDS